MKKDLAKVRKMTKKLSKYWWMDYNPKGRITNYFGNEGVINLLWAWKGQPDVLRQQHFDSDFYLMREISNLKVGEALVKEWATLLTFFEFGRMVQKHPEEFSEYTAMTQWKKIFTKKSKV